MKILTKWLRSAVPDLVVEDRQLAEDLTLRGIAVEGVEDLGLSATGEANGSLFEMDITTNRVDAMNHYGIAREAATIYGLPLAPLDGVLGGNGAGPFPVAIEAPEQCGRFTARVLRGVRIAPSVGRIAEYFELLGVKRISNAVDASNFVLQGMGHPTHAFDLDRIEGGIVVRLAHQGERLRLLDGTERVLVAEDLVVADRVKALGLAGVMGGWESMITAETRNVLVEAAWFDPMSVRRSARRHGLHTDASHRYERGADFNACAVANGLVSKLILESGGAAEGLADVVVPAVALRTAARPPIALSVAQVQRHLGTILPGREGLTVRLVARYLTALGCELVAMDGDSFRVKLPSWRLDLEREIDLVEEVARVNGYNGFAKTLPVALPVVADPMAAKEAAVRARLLALGYSEAISSTFSADADGAAFFAPKQQGSAGGLQCPVALENPLSEEARLLRPSLVPGMVAMVGHNLNRDVREVRLFEQGVVFAGTADDGGSVDQVLELASLSIGLTGQAAASPLSSAKDAGFFELKGVVESLVSLFAASTEAMGTNAAEGMTFSTAAPGWLEPERSATALLGSFAIARFGELARGQREARKLRQPVYLAEIDVTALYALPLRRATARELSRFQPVERDFSFTFGDGMAWGRIAEAVERLGIAELKRLTPVEVFRGGPVTGALVAGQYALLLRCVFQSDERTLREEDLAGWSTSIVTALEGLGGAIRV